jgi:Flp pilus assembly protein TadG
VRPAACYLHFAVRPRGSNSHDEVGDAGNAVIEFVFVAVLILIPLVYFVVAVASVQRSSVAVTHAAREAGRAFATADSTDQGLQRAEVAVRLALADQGLSDDAIVRYVAADGTCESGMATPSLSPGAQFAVCVIRHASLPAIPSLISGRGITTVGRYVLHIDDYRVVAP